MALQLQAELRADGVERFRSVNRFSIAGEA